MASKKTVDLKASIKGLSFFIKKLPFFGTRVRAGEQHVFDQRGAIIIRDQEITKKNGEIVKIRGISDAGTSMVIPAPTATGTITPATAMGAYRSWPYAAIRAIADEISNIEWKVLKVKKDGKIEELDEHPIIDFLETVNDFQTGPEFKATLVSHLELTGNAYILLEGVTNEVSKPTAMHLLDPSKVQIILDKTTYPYKISRYEFTFDGRKISYQPYQIIQIKYPNPSNPFLGLGTVQGIAEWIQNDNNTTEFIHQFFQNGAQIGLTFETEFPGEDQLQALRDAFIEQHSGLHNAYKGMFLPKGVKKPTSDMQIKDMGLSAMSDTIRDRILAGFRVSKTILGTAESDTNRSTAETADYVFAKRTIKPKMVLICSFLNEFLTPRFADDVFISFHNPVPEDKEAIQKEITSAVSSMPTMTVNETREKYLGLGPIEGGEKLLSPTTYAPAVDSGKAPQYALSVREPNIGYRPKRLNKTGKTQFARNAVTRKTISTDLAAKIADIVLAVKKKGIKDMTDEEYLNVICSEKAARTNDSKVKMHNALKSINKAQQEEVMENLADEIKAFTAKTKAVDFKNLFKMDKWINLTINAVKPIASDLFGKEAEHALNLIDAPGLDVENTPAAQAAIENAMTLMSESYNKNTADLLQEKLTEGLEQGFGVAEMTDLVSQIYEFKDTVAAERVAHTETNRITNDAGKIAWKESGYVKELKWITAPTDVCVFCEDMEGETIDIEDNFFEKGDKFKVDGEVLNLDYSDVGGPPLHPNCRCHLRPVVDTSIRSADILGPGNKEGHAAIGAALEVIEKL